MEDGRFNEILSMKFLRCESIDGGGAERPLHCSRCMWGCGSGSDRDREGGRNCRAKSCKRSQL